MILVQRFIGTVENSPRSPHTHSPQSSRILAQAGTRGPGTTTQVGLSTSRVSSTESNVSSSMGSVGGTVACEQF